MATVPPNPDGPPERTLQLPLVPPHTRGGRNALLGAPPQVPDTTRHCAAPRVQVIFAPQTRQFFHQRVTLTTTGKCVMEMRTPPGNGLHPRRSLYFVPKTNVERARNSSALPALIATYIDSLPYANRRTSGAMSAPARTSSKCGICKKVPESSISPRPSTEAVIPLIAATDSRLQKRFVYASFMDF